MELNKNNSNVNLNIRSSDAGNATLLFGNQSDVSTGSITYRNDTDNMLFKVNNQQEAMRIDSSGNVGIGTTTPSEALDVTGNIKASGSITGTLATAAQTAITSVGTLTDLTVQGDATFQSKPLMSDGLEIGSGDNLELDTNIVFEKTTTDREIRITNSTAGDLSLIHI